MARGKTRASIRLLSDGFRAARWITAKRVERGGGGCHKRVDETGLRSDDSGFESFYGTQSGLAETRSDRRARSKAEVPVSVKQSAMAHNLSCLLQQLKDNVWKVEFFCLKTKLENMNSGESEVKRFLDGPMQY